MRVTLPLLIPVLVLAILTAPAAYLWYFSRHRGGGRHVLGRPIFDGDPGGWGATGPTALLLAGNPPIDWAAAPLPDMAENHADFFGVPPPKYTELDAWRAEENAERLATTDTRFMLAAIVRGLEFRDLIDTQAGLIVERVLAELSVIDITADLS